MEGMWRPFRPTTSRTIHFQLDALGDVNRQVAEFSRNKRPGRTMGRYPLELDVLPRKAQAGEIAGGPFPDGCASIVRMQNAALSRSGKSLLLASVKGSLSFPIPATLMRRLFDPCGEPARQDVLAATDWDMRSDEEDFRYAAEAASRNATNRQKDSPRGLSNNSKGANKKKGDGQVLNGFKWRTGVRNRCYACDSEYSLATKRPQRKQQ